MTEMVKMLGKVAGMGNIAVQLNTPDVDTVRVSASQLAALAKQDMIDHRPTAAGWGRFLAMTSVRIEVHG